jgi:hypothetical protein
MVSVGYTVTEANIIDDEYPRILIPLKVTTPAGLEKIIGILDNTPSVPFDTVRDCFLTGAIFLENVDLNNLPVKGDLILASFDHDETSSKLICNGLSQLPREELAYVKVDELLAFHAKLTSLIQDKI